MNDSQAENVELLGFLDSFIDHFSITHFFIKPVPKGYYPIIKRKVITNKSTPDKNKVTYVILGSEHYNLLWLINELSKTTEKFDENGQPVVELKQLQRVFFWYTRAEHSYLQRLNNMARRLYQTGLLDSVKKQTSYYWLTDEGEKLLKSLRLERKKYLTKFFETAGVKKDLYNKILEVGENISPILWQTIIKESESIEIPKRSNVKGSDELQLLND
jgi:hypothetical protein